MNKSELLEIYKFKIETHAHTNPVSACSEITTDDFGKIFIEDGFQGVVITNHYTPSLLEKGNAKEIAEYYLSDYYKVKENVGDKINIILGCEMRFTGDYNDYLVYGIDENDIEKLYYYLDKGIDVFYKKFKNDKNLIIQAHPFRDGMVDTNPLSLDGIEVFNFHPGHNSRIGKAAKYASEHNEWIIMGGSDFHHLYQRKVFSIRTKYLPKDSFEFANILKSKEYIFTCGDCVILP